MRSSHPRLRVFFLLLVALLLAGHPWLRATAPLTASSDPLAADLQFALCSLHGGMRGGDGVPVQDRETPTCPWCALGTGPGPHLTAITAVPIDVLRPPRTLYAALVALATPPPPPFGAWLAPPPRAPPRPSA
ncbi:MAG TPA: hypothetical protein VFR00_00375 [Hyphomicrobiaceae bacterium]|jgi:hypothetical protein|nr:hypothetical protein [Hyphomicrobiaceae bacterium]